MRRFSLYALCFLLFLPLLSAGAEVKPAKVYEAPKQIVISFAGDCVIGNTPIQRRQPDCFEEVVKKQGMAYPFAKVASLFQNDDLTVVNLESVFYNHEANKVKKTYNFRAPTNFVNVLTQGGVDAVSIANNHSLDYGTRGQKSTTDTLKKAGIEWFGTTPSTRKTFVFQKDGIKIGFMGIYDRNHAARESALNAVKKLRKSCHVVIACMHGGIEYATCHDSAQEKLADALIQAGADIIIGHHPHVIQGIKVKNGRTILWSLGNFVFGGNPKLRTLNTYIAQITFSFSENNRYLGHQLNILPCHFSGSTEYNDYQPRLVQARYAREVIHQIQVDSREMRLKPYVKGVGAIQPFVPAPKK